MKFAFAAILACLFTDSQAVNASAQILPAGRYFSSCFGIVKAVATADENGALETLTLIRWRQGQDEPFGKLFYTCADNYCALDPVYYPFHVRVGRDGGIYMPAGRGPEARCLTRGGTIFRRIQ